MTSQYVVPKHCYRSRHDRVLLGVCGGLAEYTGMDPVLVRFIFSILFFVFWVGLLLYIIGLIMMRVEPKTGK